MSALYNMNVITPEGLGIVAKQVEFLKFGVVQVTIHQSGCSDGMGRRPELAPEQKREGQCGLPNTTFKGGGQAITDVTAHGEQVILTRVKLAF